MTNFERFAKALASTESEDNEVAWGDAKERKPLGLAKHDPAALYQNEAQFMACGRWQIHAAWLDTYWPDDIGVDWSWDRLFRAALLRFYGEKAGAARSVVELAMEFHLGHVAKPPSDWDEEYASRFIRYYAQLGEPEKT